MRQRERAEEPRAGAGYARQGALLLAALLLAAPASGQTRPLDLSDAQPRPVQVWFERSPIDQPGRLAQAFEGPFAARVAPGPRIGELTLRIPADVVERHLLRDYRPVAGSFSDFVWHVSTDDGLVRWAGLHGEVVQPVSVGFARVQARTRIRVEMSSEQSAGFRAPVRRFGHEVFHYCEPDQDRNCRVVPARHYDPATGYVNAVGRVRARTGPFSIETFSPLGEARFHELDATTAAWSPESPRLR